MPCSKELRNRSTNRDTPMLAGVRKLIMTSNRVPVTSYHNWSMRPATFSKSIVDYHCVFTQDVTGPSVDPKVGCSDCVKRSKQSFNMVRSEKQFYQSNFSIVNTYAVSKLTAGNTRESEDLMDGGDGYVVARSHAQLPTETPTPLELSNALRKITPSVDKFFPTVQIYETLFELRELRKLLDLFRVRVRNAPTDTFTGHYLGFNFGYIPLVTTIEDVITILLTLDNVIDKWNDFASSDRIMDFHGTIRKTEMEDNFMTGGETHTNSFLDFESYEYKYSYNDVQKIHLYIKPRIIPGDMRFRVLLKALGIDKPLAGFWELIPFSWLVDYFVNVDDMIERWETGLNSMFKFDVESLGYSHYSKMVVESRRLRHWHKGTHAESPWSYSERTLFTRTPLSAATLRDAIIPTEWGWADGPGGQQWTYVLAVANNMRP